MMSMKDFSPITKIYVFSIMIIGLLLFGINIQYVNPNDWLKILVVTAIGSAAMIVKTEGATERWHFSINFLVYSFSILNLGLTGTILVILVSNLAYWAWYRKDYKGKWYIIIFNIASFIFVSYITVLVYQALNPSGNLQNWNSIVAIFVSMAVFTIVNHLLVGIIVWLARGQNFSQSGVFELMPVLIDFTLLVMGAGLNVLWAYNPTAILLYVLPLYLIYSTLRVPALERQTEIDQKTGLYNHGYFIGQLEHELARANRFGRPLTVILCDLDLLRNINNTYGHLAGDEVLKGIGKILRESVREYDIVARFGGEEFSILMPETNSKIAFKRAELIRKTIEMSEFTVPTSIEPIRATMSFGVASRSSADQTKDEILHNADTVLYRAKLNGRNRTQIYQEGETNSGAFQGGENSQPPENLFDQGETYAAAYSHYQKPSLGSSAPDSPSSIKNVPPTKIGDKQTKHVSEEPITPAKSNYLSVNAFIGVIVILASFFFLYFYQPFPIDQIWGLFLFALLVIITEWFSVDIYVRDTAVSTSAAPILAGALLFGPLGSLALSMIFAFTAFLKFRGPFSRVFFNTANQLLAAMLYLGIMEHFSLPYQSWRLEYQLLFALFAIMLTFLVTTFLIAIGRQVQTGENLFSMWKNQFAWLTPYYAIMGLMGYALIFGYATAGYFGVILVTTPLMMLRYSQEQYINRTKAVVLELREKNVRLERTSKEVADINNGLMETLAEVIDLRDENVLHHSRMVTKLATQIAVELKLPSRQTEVIRQASLLHDVGKLGIAENVLGKPASLTNEEYEAIKKHPEIGALLLDKSVALRHLIPIVQHHHEHFDGTGYPKGLRGNEIPLEARIVGIADAVEAMNSKRPYHEKRTPEEIIVELERCAGSQFDPEIVPVVIGLIRSGALQENPAS
jgi:diguanylate cyclase (GGDEF)-like protein/putative nucleotidyltransferase with HDIG domain